MDSYRESSMSRDGRDDSENASPLQIAAEAANALRFGARGLVRGLSGGHRRQELSTRSGMNEKLPFVETETNRNLAQAARAQSRKWCKRATTLGSRDIWRRRVRVMMLHFLGSGVVCMACVYMVVSISGARMCECNFGCGRGAWPGAGSVDSVTFFKTNAGGNMTFGESTCPNGGPSWECSVQVTRSGLWDTCLCQEEGADLGPLDWSQLYISQCNGWDWIAWILLATYLQFAGGALSVLCDYWLDVYQPIAMLKAGGFQLIHVLKEIVAGLVKFALAWINCLLPKAVAKKLRKFTKPLLVVSTAAGRVESKASFDWWMSVLILKIRLSAIILAGQFVGFYVLPRWYFGPENQEAAFSFFAAIFTEFCEGSGKNITDRGPGACIDRLTFGIFGCFFFYLCLEYYTYWTYQRMRKLFSVKGDVRRISIHMKEDDHEVRSIDMHTPAEFDLDLEQLQSDRGDANEGMVGVGIELAWLDASGAKTVRDNLARRVLRPVGKRRDQHVKKTVMRVLRHGRMSRSIDRPVAGIGIVDRAMFELNEYKIEIKQPRELTRSYDTVQSVVKRCMKNSVPTNADAYGDEPYLAVFRYQQRDIPPLATEIVLSVSSDVLPTFVEDASKPQGMGVKRVRRGSGVVGGEVPAPSTEPPRVKQSAPSHYTMSVPVSQIKGRSRIEFGKSTRADLHVYDHEATQRMLLDLEEKLGNLQENMEENFKHTAAEMTSLREMGEGAKAALNELRAVDERLAAALEQIAQSDPLSNYYVLFMMRFTSVVDACKSINSGMIKDSSETGAATASAAVGMIGDLLSAVPFAKLATDIVQGGIEVVDKKIKKNRVDSAMALFAGNGSAEIIEKTAQQVAARFTVAKAASIEDLASADAAAEKSVMAKLTGSGKQLAAFVMSEGEELHKSETRTTALAKVDADKVLKLVFDGAFVASLGKVSVLDEPKKRARQVSDALIQKLGVENIKGAALEDGKPAPASRGGIAGLFGGGSRRFSSATSSVEGRFEERESLSLQMSANPMLGGDRWEECKDGETEEESFKRRLHGGIPVTKYYQRTPFSVRGWGKHTRNLHLMVDPQTGEECIGWKVPGAKAAKEGKVFEISALAVVKLHPPPPFGKDDGKSLQLIFLGLDDPSYFGAGSTAERDGLLRGFTNLIARQSLYEPPRPSQEGMSPAVTGTANM